MNKPLLRHGRSEPHIICQCINCEPKNVNKSSLFGKIGFTLFILSMVLISSCSLVHGDMVSIAESQIGKGEIGGNNKGLQIEKYTKGKDVAWCAAFVSWTIQHSGKERPYLLSAKSYWKIYRSSRVRSPRPGDVICFYRGGRRSGYGHVGIVEYVRGNRLITIEGNVGRYPAKVKRVTYNIHHIPNLLGFVRIL